MEQTHLPVRRRPAHGVHISLNDPTIVWLSVCTKDRNRWLTCNEAHKHLIDAWVNAAAWSVGRYVLMPDHLHLFCSPKDLNIPLDNWVRYWKSLFSRATRQDDWRWQTGHWDTRLRRHESYSEKWTYVIQNPVRAGLVSQAEEWPYQGVLNELRW